MNQSSRVLTVSEVADLVGISRSLAYQLVARGEIPFLRFGRRIVIPREAVDSLLASTIGSDVRR